MLSSRLTFTQRESNFILVLLIAGILTSCSNISAIKKVKKNTSTQGDYCERTQSESPDERSLIFAAKYKSNGIANCFRNYLRFEKSKKQLVKMCTRLNVKRSGKVSFVKVFGVSPKRVPKDLAMCIEQEYWKMAFNGLQLDRSYSVKFPLNLSSM